MERIQVAMATWNQIPCYYASVVRMNQNKKKKNEEEKSQEILCNLCVKKWHAHTNIINSHHSTYIRSHSVRTHKINFVCSSCQKMKFLNMLSQFVISFPSFILLIVWACKCVCVWACVSVFVSLHLLFSMCVRSWKMNAHTEWNQQNLYRKWNRYDEESPKKEEWKKKQKTKCETVYMPIKLECAKQQLSTFSIFFISLFSSPFWLLLLKSGCRSDVECNKCKWKKMKKNRYGGESISAI